MITAMPGGELTGGGAGDRPPLPEAVARSSAGFVGRSKELDLVIDFQRTAGPDPRLVLLTGDSGMGKRSLAAAIASAAYDDGLAVLWGSCEEHAQRPFHAFAQALRPYVPDLADLLPPLEGGLEALAGLAGRAARTQLFDAITELLVRVSADRAVVLVLTDLQWATDASVDLLRHLLLVDEPLALFVVATISDADLDPESSLAGQLAHLSQRDEVQRLTLRGLTKSEIGELIAGWPGMSGNFSLVGTIQDETGGHAYWVTEQLWDLAERGLPIRLSDPTAGDSIRRAQAVVVRRLGHRDVKVRRVLQVASLVGGAFEAAVIARVAEAAETEAEVTAALDESVAAGFVQQLEPGVYRFAHRLTRLAAYRRVPPTHRSLIHAQLAAAIEEVHADDLEPYRSLLAYEYRTAEREADVGRALDAELAAGRQAARLTDFETAASHARAGLDRLERSPDDPARRCALLTLAAITERDAARAEQLALRAIDAGGRVRWNLAPLQEAIAVYAGVARPDRPVETVAEL